MDHHGNTVGLSAAIDSLKLFYAVHVVIGIKQLVRRMDLDEANAEPNQIIHLRLHVERVPGMHAAAGDQAPGIFLAIVGYPLVHLMAEAHGFRRYIINEHGAVNADGVQILEQGLGRPAVLQDVLIMASGLLHYFKRPSLEHIDGLNVDVAVGDEHFEPRVNANAREVRA